MRSVDIHVRGIVQGVGFRPFVYRTAQRNLVSGWVLNASDGVHIHAEGDARMVQSFVHDIEWDAPAAAAINAIEVTDAPSEGCSGFEIRESVSMPAIEHGDEQRADAAMTGVEQQSQQRQHPATRTDISPDLATCPDCLRELFDSGDRRFHYPFINCTNCGPRFTIIRELPYDRPATSMREFAMCPACAAEYADPADRRFHAQPDACFACGPQLSLSIVGEDGAQTVEWGTESLDTDSMRRRSDELLQRVADLLLQGRIVAIKGLGGYHLACLATSQPAVIRLRQRKHRLGKPLAIMVRDVSMARALCQVSAAEQQLLESPAAPIVLLQKRHDDAANADDVQAEPTPLPCALAPSVAGELHEVGVMLPNTPVQHLLMQLVHQPLVMTSANFSEEPIIAANDEAHRRLASVADAFLDNNRAIVSRYDDSVARVVTLPNGQPYTQMVRRARGYAPRPVPFPQLGSQGQPARDDALQADGADDVGSAAATILGVGPQMKSTFALTCSDKAYVSQHIGDLANAPALESWSTTLELYQRMFNLQPSVIACDMHPAYLSTQWAQQAAQDGQRVIAVQHHHAHIAAVIGENVASGQLSDPCQRVIGVALDGTGAGEDGTVWGGELLVCDCSDYQRLGHLSTMPIVGGEQAIRHPWRLTAGLLLSAELSQHPAAQRFFSDVDGQELDVLQQMLERGINCVQTSSAGRLLDAMSALLGICRDATFDGEAPMLLEALAHQAPEAQGDAAGCGGDAQHESVQSRNGFSGYAMPLVDTPAATDAGAPANPFAIDVVPLVRAVLDDLLQGLPTSSIAWRIHHALAAAVVQGCLRIRRDTGLDTVALSGGVFANRLLLTQVTEGLMRAGFCVLLPRQLPPNDGCISYGQAVVATARMAR